MDDAEALWAALQGMERETGLIAKLMAKLGWTNDRLRLAAMTLKGRGRIRAFIVEDEGEGPMIVALEV